MKNEEIKEILDRLDFNEWEVDLYEVPISWCELYNIRDYITNLQQLYENGLKVNQNSHKYITELEMNNAILKEDLDKSNDIIEKDRQFYKCRMDEYVELKKENERLNNKIKEQNLLLIEFQDMEQKVDIYKSRCEKTIELYKKCKEEDYCILSIKMYEILIGSDENE